ncbi:N-acetylmuramoyl-L-alanine amidase [Agrobacterium vaccinii]|uniref:N-acetylmuramoyl-L-alanine amidase n=1 Tax=Agrobacterium vaccinii TaxID=2735528 RepID=UPI001E522572|nr:N-acetylmuramoyl-L-alanine amidase [Agrobacterium vaccinii]UHS61463.1 N-acetylmuramoyl-L-alanine amidase [Agrobacterium vaccinii]
MTEITETTLTTSKHLIGGVKVAILTTLAGRIASVLLVAALCAPIVLSSANATDKAPSLIVSSARIIGDEARTRIVMDFNEEPEFEVHYLDGPARIVVDFPAVGFSFPTKDLAPTGLFSDIRFGTMGEGSARLVLTAKKPVQVAIADVKAEDGGKVYRFVLDTEIATKQKFADLLKNQNWQALAPATTASVTADVAPKTSRQSDFVIAVDAGHGGIDAGAKGGVSGTDEKVITLTFAKELTDRLNKIGGIRAFLTRDDDTFLALSERVTLARQQNANLFISVHADTLKQKGIRGATVYTISDRASDRMAQDLAERENLSDQIAGVAQQHSQPEVADILLDLTRRETQAFSVTLAENIVKSFEGQIGLINNPHRYAGFQVLRAHDVPSVLLELGFLSNPDDEKLLLDETWRQKVADTLAVAVTRYRAQALANGG